MTTKRKIARAVRVVVVAVGAMNRPWRATPRVIRLASYPVH
jgi:hypothetical protein